jgi:hypothetical protein
LRFSNSNNLRLPFQKTLKGEPKAHAINGLAAQLHVERGHDLAMRAYHVLGVLDTEYIHVACQTSSGNEKVDVNGLPSLPIRDKSIETMAVEVQREVSSPMRHMSKRAE